MDTAHHKPAQTDSGSGLAGPFPPNLPHQVAALAAIMAAHRAIAEAARILQDALDAADHDAAAAARAALDAAEDLLR